MSARQDINRLFERWVDLTRAEGRAIRAAQWDSVKKFQAEKKLLQDEITAARERLGREEGGQEENKTPFHENFGRLMSLENKNARLLAEQVRRRAEELRSLDQAQQNLQRIRRSYLQRPPRPPWQCLH